MPYLENKLEMPNQVTALYKEMNKELSAIEQGNDAWITRIKKAIDLLHGLMERLQEFVHKTNFQTQQEEINFFKFIKPRFNSQLIFYIKLYKFETMKPVGSIEDQRTYIWSSMKKEQAKLEEEAPLYTYFNSGATYLDQLYFTRGIKDIDITYKSYLTTTDNQFTTAQDFTFSKFLAIESFIKYLEDQLSKFIDAENASFEIDEQLEYVGKKWWLVQLIYGLYYSGAFKNGSLKNIAATVQRMTNTNLGNFYRTNQELRIKLNEETAFDIWNRAYKKGNEESDANPRY